MARSCAADRDFAVEVVHTAALARHCPACLTSAAHGLRQQAGSSMAHWRYVRCCIVARLCQITPSAWTARVRQCAANASSGFQQEDCPL